MALNGDKLRVLVVDDSEVVRLKLRGLLAHEPGFDQVGEAPDGETGVHLAHELQPDVVIMDLKMPGISGIEATWQLGTAAPRSHVLVLTVSSEQDDVADAIMAGAFGYVVKGAADAEIRDAIRRVADGKRTLSPEVAGTLIERVHGTDEPTTSVGNGTPEAAAAATAAPLKASEVPAARTAAATKASDVPAGGTPPAPNAPGVPERGVPAREAKFPPLAQIAAIALLAGALLTGIGQGEEIAAGTATGETWITAALNVVVATLLLGLGMLAGRLSVRR